VTTAKGQDKNYNGSIQQKHARQAATQHGLQCSHPCFIRLFQVNKDTEKLDEDTAQLFYHNVAKLLFLCKQAHSDIQTTVTFL
jgi:hypothetical protein